MSSKIRCLDGHAICGTAPSPDATLTFYRPGHDGAPTLLVVATNIEKPEPPACPRPIAPGAEIVTVNTNLADGRLDERTE